MKATAFLLSFTLLLSLASASGFSACFLYPSAVGFSVENTSYPGAYGNYTVYVVAYPPPSMIRVEGPDASTNALSQELTLLQKERMLETSCNSSEISVFSYQNYACAPDGAWQDDDQAGLCGQGAYSKTTGALDTVPPQEGAAKTGSMETSIPSPARSADTIQAAKAGAEGSAPTQQGITLEQLLPLFAGFLAVVVLSYLVLQQRQIQLEIDPQEERLLSNETRAGIMNELSEADRIPTDLSVKLGKSKATIVEHLDALTGAGFVERVATPGKKFVFYRLTQKGKRALLRRAG